MIEENIIDAHDWRRWQKDPVTLQLVKDIRIERDRTQENLVAGRYNGRTPEETGMNIVKFQSYINACTRFISYIEEQLEIDEGDNSEISNTATYV